MTEKKGQIQEKSDFVHVSGEFELSKLELSGVLLLVGVYLYAPLWWHRLY